MPIHDSPLMGPLMGQRLLSCYSLGADTTLRHSWRQSYLSAQRMAPTRTLAAVQHLDMQPGRSGAKRAVGNGKVTAKGLGASGEVLHGCTLIEGVQMRSLSSRQSPQGLMQECVIPCQEQCNRATPARQLWKIQGLSVALLAAPRGDTCTISACWKSMWSGATPRDHAPAAR